MKKEAKTDLKTKLIWKAGNGMAQIFGKFLVK